MPDPATTLVLAKLGELGPHHRKSINPCDNRLSPIAAQSLIGGLVSRGDRCIRRTQWQKHGNPPKNPEQRVTRFAMFV